MNKNINTAPIRLDIEKDKNVKKPCESCQNPKSEFLYVVQNKTATGIFHICHLCICTLSEEIPHLLIPKY
jgi:hypothetical protein